MDTVLTMLFVLTVKLLEYALPIAILLGVAIFAIKTLGNVFKPIYIMFEIFFYVLVISFHFIKSIFQHGLIETIKHTQFGKRKEKAKA